MEKVNQILKDLKNKNYKPVYFFQGEEPFFIDLLVDYMEEHILDESAKAFDQLVLYGKDVTMLDVVSAAKKFPMISDKQLIIVKEAANIKDTEHLVGYIKNPQPTTILVIAHKHGKVDGKTKLGKQLPAGTEYLLSEKLKDHLVTDWIKNFVQQKDYTIEPKAANMLFEFLGNDLTKIKNELQKLFILIPPKTNITPHLIEDNIGFSKDYNVYELQRAIALNDSTKSYKIVHHFANNPKSHPLVMVTGSMYNFFSLVLKYHGCRDKSPKAAAATLGLRGDYFLKDPIEAARHIPMRKVSAILESIKLMDLKAKGVESGGMTELDLYKDLLNFIFKK